MTGIHWTTASAREMLDRLQGSPPPPYSRATLHRKYRQFAAACGRLAWDYLDDDRSKRAIEVTELYADDLASGLDMAQATEAAETAISDIERTTGRHAHGAAAAHQAAACIAAWSRDDQINSVPYRVADNFHWLRHALLDVDPARAPHLDSAQVLRDLVRDTAQPGYTDLQVGDTVIARDPDAPLNFLHASSGIYDCAIVVSLDPFAIASEHGDMLWATTHHPCELRRAPFTRSTKAAFQRWQNDKDRGTRYAHRRYRHFPPAINDWQEGTVRKLATGIYQERTLDALPILADALEEAGCQDQDTARKEPWTNDSRFGHVKFDFGEGWDVLWTGLLPVPAALNGIDDAQLLAEARRRGLLQGS